MSVPNVPNAFAEYCHELGTFDSSNIDRVAEIMERHQQSPVLDFPTPQIYTPKQGKSIEVWDRVPADYADTVVAYSTSGNSLTPNILFRFMPLAEALPSTRLILVGSNGGIGKQTAKIALGQIPATFQGDYTATVEPVLDYLKSKGVKTSKQQGYSLGAEMPPVAAVNAERFDHKVTRMVLMDPTRVGVEIDGATVARGRLSLATTLTAADKDVADYQNAAMSPSYRAAIEQSSPDWIGSLPVKLRPLAFLRLASLTNLAYFNGQTKPYFETNMHEALAHNPELTAMTAWGIESTLALDGLLQGITCRLQEKHGSRAQAMRLPGLTHGFGNNIYLHTLVTLQALATDA